MYTVTIIVILYIVQFHELKSQVQYEKFCPGFIEFMEPKEFIIRMQKAL